MSNVTSLVNSLVGEMAPSGPTIEMGSFTHPYYPACILYYGERSSRFKRDVDEGLREYWGKSTDSIPCFTLSSPLVAASDQGGPADSSPDGFSAQDLQGALRRLLTNTGAFSEMNICDLFCIVDTAGMTAEEFGDWYRSISPIKGLLKGINLQTMLIVLVQNGIGQSNAGDIRSEIGRLYEDPELANRGRHLYNGLFLFEDRQRNQAFNDLFVEHGPYDRGAWNIVPDVIYIADSDDQGCRRLLFSGDLGVTCAMRQLTKPIQGIVSASLRSVVEDVKAANDRLAHARPNRSRMDDILGGGATDGDYAQGIRADVNEVFERFDGFEAGLPSKDPSTPISRGMSFGQANALSMGCLEQFFRDNHLAAFRKSLVERTGGRGDMSLQDAIVQRISQRVSAPEFLSLSREDWQRAVAGDHAGQGGREDASALTIQDAIRQRLLREAAVELESARRRAIDVLYSQAEDTEKAFSAVVQAVGLEANVNEEGLRAGLVDFYEGIVGSFFGNTSHADPLGAQVLRIGNGEAEILEALHRVMDDVMDQSYETPQGARQVYKLGFMDEQVVRSSSGTSQVVALNRIGEDLVKDMSSIVALRSDAPFGERAIEAYILRNDMNDEASSQLVSFLKDRAMPPGTSRAFFGTSSSNWATSIWFYELDKAQLA